MQIYSEAPKVSRGKKCLVSRSRLNWLGNHRSKTDDLLPDLVFSSFDIRLNSLLFLLHFSSEELYTQITYHSDLNIRELRSTLPYLLMGGELSRRQRTLPRNEGNNVLFQVVLFSSIPGLPNYSPMSLTASLLTLKM